MNILNEIAKKLKVQIFSQLITKYRKVLTDVKNDTDDVTKLTIFMTTLNKQPTLNPYWEVEGV